MSGAGSELVVAGCSGGNKDHDDDDDGGKRMHSRVERITSRFFFPLVMRRLGQVAPGEEGTPLDQKVSNDLNKKKKKKTEQGER